MQSGSVGLNVEMRKVIYVVFSLIELMIKMKRPMEIMGTKARDVIENFMKAFPDYEIEHVIANLELKLTKIQGSLEIKIREKQKEKK